MDAKDLRTGSAVSERNNDGSKYSQGGGIALHCDRNKSYQEIGSNSLGKVDVPNARPCAVIGPDRVVPPPAASEAYHIKKGPAEPWPCMDNGYRRPPEYPHKLTNYQNPTRNISPRQTFQENMQRIMVPPTYNAIKVNDDTNYAQVSDRSNGLSKNIKLNMPPEAKFCDVPYAVNPTNNEHKNVRNPETCLPSANPTHTRTAPHGWPPGSVNLRSTRMYSAPELYQYQDYPSCAGPRPVLPRPHRTVPEEPGYVYAEPYYQEGNIRFKPYPTIKERYPQQRYEYIGNYANPFHPPLGFPSHKYEVQKSVPPHPYPPYAPMKYLESRVAEPAMEGYQRNPQALGPNYNIQYRNQVIHPNYGVIANSPQNKMHSYPPDAHMKSIPPNKLPYDNTKTYIEYENSRPKIYPPSESYFVNEMVRMPMKSQVIMPNYSTLNNMHNMPPNPYYKKDAHNMKNYDHMAHFRNMDPNINIHNPMSRHAPVFSPNTLAISPTDSNTSNDTAQTLGTSQEDCGYVSQSSTASVRSIDSGINRIPNEYIRKYYDNRYGPIVRTSPMMSKSQLNSNNNASKDKKQIDVRQFLQMWNEGDEEQEENGSKEIVIQTGSNDKNNFGKSHPHETMNSQEQLYVLGLVNVPSEELAKYEHIQKVSKLPENIKGYNSIELLNQFEEVIESSHLNNYKTPKESMYHMPMKGAHQKQATGVMPPRPVSPLDVEAKISQSVIHKEVGCNFEIKPCSPKMLNVEVAAPVQNILAERSIEKVANQVMLKSPINSMNENIDCNMMKRTDHRMNMSDNLRIPSCKMINTQFSSSNSMDPMKSSYSIQDLESNSGLCLASLPRLDNDIELNFPEVNQQFINANRGDSTVLQTSIRDLPTLEVLDQSPNQIKDKFNNTIPSRPEYDIVKSPYMVDSEKEFSKLSKYRKTKNFEPKETLIQHNVNAFRTDSVIIKNPENIKNHEENSDFTNSLNKVIMDIQQAPINLTSQGSLSSNLESQSDNIDLQKAEKEKQVPVEIAIDFSLNKTGTLNTTYYMETKVESQINTSTEIVENPLNTLNNDDSSDSVSLLPVLTDEENENISNMDNINENYSLGWKKDGKDVPIKETDQNNDGVGSKAIPASTKSFQRIESDIGKRSSNSAEEMIVDVRSALPASKTEIPDNELVSNVSSESSENEFCDSENSTTDELIEDTNYTLTEVESEISQNPPKILEEKYEMDTAENTTNVAVAENFCENRNFVDNINSPVHAETKRNIDTSEINAPSEVSYPVVTELIQQDHENVLIARDETCSNICASSDLIQSQNTNSMQTVNSEDHIECEDIIKDEAITNKESEPSVDKIDNIVAAVTPLVTCEFNETNDPYLESDQDSYENTDIIVEPQLNSDIDTKNSGSPPISKDFVIDQISDNVEERTKIQSLNTNSESPPISKDFVIDQLRDDVKDDTKIQSLNTNSFIHSKNFVIDQLTDDAEDGIKIQSPNTNSGLHPISKDFVIDQISDDVEDRTKIQSLNTNSESHPTSKDFEINHLSGDVEDSTKIQSLNKNSQWHPTKKDFVIDHITDDVEDSTPIQSQNPNSESHPISKDFEIDRLSDDVEDSTTIQALNTNSESQPISKDFVIDHITDDVEDSTPIQSRNTNSESQPISKDFVIDHITDDIEDSTQSDTDEDSTSQSSEELSDREKDLMDFEETYCDGTQNSPINTERCDLDQTVDGDPEHQREKPFIKNIWYGSKALYSPWIQKLLTFSEGNCNNTTAKNDINVDKDLLFDSAETVNTTSENDDHDVSELDIPKTVLLEDTENQYNKTLAKDVNEEQDNSNYTVKKTVDTSILNSSILDNNIDETVNSEDHINCEDSNKGEVIKNRESEPAVDEVDKIVAAGTPKVTCEFNDTNVTDPSLKSVNTAVNSETQLNVNIETQCEEPVASQIEEVLCESFQQETEHCDEQAVNKQAELESSDHFEHVRFSFNGLQANDVSYKKCQRLKRSLSDSALNIYNNDERPKQDDEENVQFIWPFKRRKMNTVENNLLAQKLCNIIHHNRRNSVSSFYNEENVSFCIVIDNSCIIAEEESEEPEKECYTELSEECIAEIQNSCTNHDENTETLPEVVPSPQQENACDYSDSFVLDCEEDKTLEESWDEDVGCVETVISDDVAEDIEICGPSSPKDDALSDNDESGVFSSSEHTDRVKFIYGDKMCNDDALLVETLYKTPQMDVNKTLYNRETRVSEEYYDNDSLEKMLSETNERPVSPYVPQFMDAMFPSGKVNSKETPENKENMDIETFPSFQSKGNALDIVVDINVDKSERENMHSIEIFAKTRETVHSCESSVDNVFTYSQKDEDAIYTSSSPEVSSTTSEEKNSGILLKITNYKGSRISQINDISRVNKRSSCKFTEEKDYLHTHNRPLLTKAAQKYIPPLKESIRDLKVKLSLPQHSLMKLKQLKISKDEPKVNKQNSSIPRIPKKPKPKFEDVLKSIDEIQFKKHKEKTKKTKKSIPKVVIKKNLNGSHYASTSNKDDFNPDLTGRKWQPWVFIEKNHFIDKMATRKKTKAVYSHRQRTYVLAEKFQKYKSASSAKFVISPPLSDNPSSGLKYTIRLKHNY